MILNQLHIFMANQWHRGGRCVSSTLGRIVVMFIFSFLAVSNANAAKDLDVKSDSASFFFVNGTSGNVGVSTFAPNALFDVSSQASQNLLLINDDGTGDTSPFLITSIGNVGVGSLTPGEKVDVQGTVRALQFVGGGAGITGITSAGGFTDGTNVVYTTVGSDNVGIGTSTPQGGLVVTNGNVGIGTWAPTSALYVNGIATVKNTAGSSYVEYGPNYIQSYNGNLAFNGSGNDVNFARSNIGIGTTLTTTSALSVMNGNVGIGTWIPAQALSVNGNITMQNGRADFTVSANAPKLLINTGSLSGAGNAIQFFTGGSLVGAGVNQVGVAIQPTYNQSGASAGTDLLINRTETAVGTGPQRLQEWQVAGASKMVIDTAGNVGIGTLTPFGGKLIIPTTGGNVGIGSLTPGTELDVTGTVRATQFVGGGAGITGITSAGGFTDGTNVVYTTVGADNVGIGTTTPQGGLVVTNGNVGIGTWAPTALEHIVQIGAVDAFRVDDAEGDVTPFTINSAGNVGIGTSVISDYLEIASTAGTGIRFVNTTTNQGAGANMGTISFYSADTNNAGVMATIVGRAREGDFGSNGELRFATTPSAGALTDRFIIATSGNIGIATTKPFALLDISSTAAQDLFRINDNGTDDPTPLIISSTGNVGIGTFSPFGGQLIIPTAGGNVGIGSLTPGTALDVTGTVRATQFVGGGAGITGITNAGGFTDGTNVVYTTVGADNVGIGTTTPQAGLVVSNGNVGIGTWTADNARISFGPLASTQGLNLYELGNTRYGMGIGTGEMRFYYTSAAPGHMSFGTMSSANGTTFTEKMRLDTNGNLGIGTVGPNALLEVSSTAAQDLFRVSDDGTGDASTFLITSIGNVGIGSEVPGEKVDVQGTVRATQFIGGGAGITGITSAGGLTDDGTIVHLTTSTDNIGIGTTDASQGKLIVAGGNVGIASVTPGTELDVTGTVRATQFVGGGAGITGITNAGGWTDGTNVVYATVGADNVGIGTTTPQGGLVVTNGNMGIGTWAPRGLLEVNNGASSSSVFLIDSSGNIGIGTTRTTANGLSLLTGNVGIGTWVAGSAFDVRTSGHVITQILSTGSTSNATFVLGHGTTGAGLVQTTDWKFGRNGSTVFVVNQNSGGGAGRIPLGIEVGAATQAIWVAPGASATNALVGIGTLTPSSTMQILNQATNRSFVVEDQPVDTTPFVINDSGNVGIGTVDPLGGKLIIPTSEGNVGIGSLTPGTELDVTGTVRATQFVGGGAGITGITSAGGFTDGTNVVYTTVGSDNVGIGTTTPQAALVVTNGNVGIGTWTAEGALVVMNGNVGIGTNAPQRIDGARSVSLVNSDTGERAMYHALSFSNTPAVSSEVQLQRSRGTQAVPAPAESGDRIGGVFYSGNTDTAVPGSNQVGIISYAAENFTTSEMGAKLAIETIGIGSTTRRERFQVDGNGNIGVGTFGTARAVLDVTSDLGQDLLRINDDGIPDASPFVISSTGNIGIGTTVPFGGKVIIPTAGGNVGIGSLTPGTELDVTGTVRATAFSGDGSALINVPGGGWTDGTNVVYATVGTDNVGIGTTTPQTRLSVWDGNVGIGTITADNGRLIVMGGNVGIGSFNPSMPLDVLKTNEDSYREVLARYKISDSSNDSLMLASATNVNSTFIPAIAGYRASVTTGPSLSLWGLTDSAGDAGDSSLLGLIALQGFVTSSATDPTNGTLSAPSNRKLFTVGTTGGDVKVTVTAVGNLGISTTNPASRLAVVGGVGIGTVTAGQPYTQVAAPPGGLIVESNVGIGTFNPFGGKMIVTGGNVGIGSLTPGTALDVTGTVRATAFSGDGSALINVPGGGWTDGTNVVYTTVGADNVGIGTSTPQGGFVVTNGNVGMGTWAPSALGHIVQVAAANAFRVDDVAADTTPFIITSTGNIGIGTTIVDRMFMIDDGTAASNGNRIAVETAVGGAANRTLSVYGHGDATSGNMGWVLQNTYTTSNGVAPGKIAINPSAGNVGIGTFFPTAALNVVQTGTDDSFKVEDRAGDTSPFVIDSGGNVGIGSTLPRQKLEVDGALLFDTHLIFEEDSVTNTGSLSYSDPGLSGFNSDGTFVFNTDVAVNDDVTVPTAGIGVSGLYSSTNVGIGTFRPKSLLSVGGGGVGIGTNSNSSFLQFTAPVGSLIAESNVGLGTYVPKGGLELKGTFIARPSATTAITAGGGSGGVTAITNTVMRIQGNGGAADISVNPQIVAGIDGQIVMLVGASDTNTVKFDDGTGLQLASGVSFTLGLGDTITLMYDTPNAVWVELGRSDN